MKDFSELSEQEKEELARQYRARFEALFKELVSATAAMIREGDRVGLLFLAESCRACFTHAVDHFEAGDGEDIEPMNDGWVSGQIGRC